MNEALRELSWWTDRTAVGGYRHGMWELGFLVCGRDGR